MQTEPKESADLSIVDTTLRALARLRKERHNWIDGEVETAEALAFKIGECLKPFLIAKRHFPEHFGGDYLSKHLGYDTIRKDISSVFSHIRKRGFYPSPYSPLPNVSDQYTDFAAFSLEFCDLVYEYAKDRKQKKLLSHSQSVCKKALDFLIDRRHFLSDSNGVRWSGTTAYYRVKRKGKEYFTDTYFTSLVAIALRNVLEKPVLLLTDKQKARVRDLIRNAGRWLVYSYQPGLMAGDESRKKDKTILYTTWGLRALIDTYDTQDEVTRKVIPAIVAQYIRALEEKIESDDIALVQEYFRILSPTVEEVLDYDDRSAWGGVFNTLVSLPQVSSLDSLLASSKYRQVLDDVYSGILQLRNPKSKLWYKEFLILSIHSYLVEGFLIHAKQAKDLAFSMNITSGQIRTAVREALSDDALISSFQQAVYSKLQAASRKAEQSEKVAGMIEQLGGSENAGEEISPKRVVKRTHKRRRNS